MTTISYYSILDPMVMCALLPRTEDLKTLIMADGREITTEFMCRSASSVSVLEGGTVRTYSAEDVVNISHETRLIYPELPPGYKTPERDDRLGWVRATVRAILDHVNQNSLRDFSNPLVVSVDLNMISKTLELTMTGFWSTLPLFVKQKFLNSLWDVYCTLLARYGVTLEYGRVEMFPYNSSVSVGYKSRYRSVVEGGLECTYTQHQYL